MDGYRRTQKRGRKLIAAHAEKIKKEETVTTMNSSCRAFSRSRLWRYLLVSVFMSLLPITAFGATYYASPTGSGTTCSTSSRCSYPTAVGKLSSGDTLILGDGTYNNQINVLPNGTAGAYTIVKAEHDGGAIISYSADFPLRLGNSYVQIEGIKFMNNAVDASADVAYISGGYNKILRCAFVSNPTTSNTNKVSVTVAGKYNLVEDCWTWGGGRYKFKASGLRSEDTGHHNIFRRCVARHDREWSDWNPQAIFVNYAGSDNIFQNCIAIDSTQDAYYGSYMYRGAWLFEKGSASTPTTVQGSIALNVSAGLYDSASYDYGGADYVHGNILLSDMIVWAAGEGFQTYYNYAGRVMSLNHGTFGSPNNTGGNDYPGWAFYTGNSVSDGGVATNSIFYNWNLSGKGAMSNAGGANDYNSFYGNATNRVGSTAGTHDITSINPVANSLKYLPRIESGSSLKGMGSSGSDVGATVMYRTGVSGTLYGQPGYNTLTSEPLWPWPNEDRIKADMSSYPSNWPSDNQPNPVRGFTAGTSKDGSPQTLTKYIWEYLGNQIPADIYGGVAADTSAPVITSFAIPATSASLATSVSVFAATDNVAVTGYLLTESATAPSANASGWQASPPAGYTFATAGTHTLYAWVKDGAGNVSTSRSAGVTITVSVADTTAPVVTSFLLPATSASLTVPISAFTASDNVGVSGYCVTMSNDSSGCTWNTSAPTSITFASSGSQSVFAWAKDASNNISSPVADSVSITLLPPQIPSGATGNIYYVRPDGHDGASGANNSSDSSSGAWLTLQHAANVVAAGDTVYVADGNYAGFMIQAAGKSGSPITFQAISSGANIVSRNSATADGINIESYSATLPDYITIDGFNVYNQSRIGIRAIGGRGIIIRNNTVHDNTSHGIFSGDTPAIQVLNNRSYSNGSTSFTHNIYVSNSLSDNCVIKGNTVYSSKAGNGIQVNADYQSGGDGYIDNPVIEENLVYGNKLKGLSLISIRYGKIQNNVIYNNGTSAGGVHIVEQGSTYYSVNNVVVNNTIDEPSIAAVRINANNTGNIVFNNICLGPIGIVFEGSGNYASNNYSSTSNGVFAAYASHDYRLVASSPARDFGVGSFQSAVAPQFDIIGGVRPQNGQYDAGAFEYIPVGDTSLPVVSAFTVPSTSASLTVPVTSFLVTDNVAVTGYLITENSTSPAAGAAGWTAAAPTTYVATSVGSHTLYPWAKDAAGNVSALFAAPDTVTITLPDTSLPTAVITSPANNASVSGNVNFTATATDNLGVSRMEFYLDGAIIYITNVTPYSYVWDTTSVANGTYALLAKSYDAAGNAGQSATITVTVNNPVPDTAAPIAAITSPASSASIAGTVAVSVTATDNVAVTKVEFYVNGALQATDTTSPYSFSWNSTTVANGTYTLTARAYDAAGNMGQSAAVAVSVNNPVPDTAAPTAAITSPFNSASVAGTVGVSVTATDNVAVTKVEFYVNGALQATDTTSPYSFSWNSTSVANGTYSLSARAYDAAGNIGQSSGVSVTVNNSAQTSYTIWPATAKPVVVADPDTSAIEVGMKFRSDVNGYITGIRFYKASSNTGTHVASLWTTAGKLLARATFTKETSSGWQQVNFTTPVAITANTVYVASYHTNSGHYSDDQKYFAGKGVDNGPLHALADGVSGVSGVYAYGSSSVFPNKGWNSSNYWVDVVFKK